MARLTVRFIRDPLRLSGVETHAVEFAGAVRLRDAVRRAFPDLDPDTLVMMRGGMRLDGNAPCQDGDTIVCAIRPQGTEAFWYAVLEYVVKALVLAALSYLISNMMRPKQRNKSNSPAYSVNIDQNAARLAGTIPVIYGRVLAMPDIAAQPYSEFIENNERVNMILCLGMGEYAINDVLIGEARASDYPAGTIETWIFGPQAHGQKLGVIEKTTGVMEDVFTVPESAGVDLTAPNDPTEISIAGTASGGLLKPDTPTSAEFWLGLVPGQKYTVTGAGQSVVVKFVGIGPDNSAQFDGPLPPAKTIRTDTMTGRLIAAIDAQEGAVMKLELQVPVPTSIGNICTITQGSLTRGPYKPYKKTGAIVTGTLSAPAPLVTAPDEGGGGPIPMPPDDGGGTGPGGGSPIGLPVAWLRKSGPGFKSKNDTPIDPAATLTIKSEVITVYYITPYYEGVTPTAADPYRWRGWFALSRPGKQITKAWIDIAMPRGLVWITDDGDYHVRDIEWIAQAQLIDDESNPIGPVKELRYQIIRATTNPQRFSIPWTLPVGRYRMRVARVNNRDQRASKEISDSQLAGIRAKIYHPANTPAYENCTLFVMRFTASAGLSAAASRRIKVDCTRRLPSLTTGALLGTSNPAEAFVDILENTDYGAARPRAETDVVTVKRLRTQWGTVNGFNGVFDQPITVVEALQAVLGPVNAIPLPVGLFMSVAQDAPRTRDYVFDPGTIVADSLTIGYHFNGTDEPDHLEIIYANPDTMADARVYYPTKGLRPEVVEIFGCTSAAHATAWGKLRWQERYYNRKTCQFELEGEGYLIQPLTRFGIALPNVDWGSGGVVLAYDEATRVVTIDQPFPQGVATIYFKGEDTGKLGTGIAVSARLTDYTLRLATSPSVAPHPADATGDATRWAATGDEKLFFEFNVTDLEATGPMRVRVSGTQYTTQKFSGTFLQGWTT
jgi:hypothetical protein